MIVILLSVIYSDTGMENKDTEPHFKSHVQCIIITT
jgi:hypothetical protein